MTGDTVEAARWGSQLQIWEVPLIRILAVLHHPGTNTTEYIVATRGLA